MFSFVYIQTSKTPQEQILFQCTDAPQITVLFPTPSFTTDFFGKQKAWKPQVSGMHFLDVQFMEAFKNSLQ